MTKPLSGVKILDLTRVLAGPYCTMLLQDLGAEIIKVEHPDTGDDSRSFSPFKGKLSLYFLSINRGKKSLALNLKQEKAKQILLGMIKKVDVIVENFKPGTMEKLGLGYETLKQINPKIIYVAMSGFGHTGPDAKKPAYDILAQALGGVMGITGWPGSPPTRVGASIGDITASLFGAIGLVSALYQRTTTGQGQKVDVAMLDCQVAILENALARYQVEGKNPEPLGNRHPGITPFQAYKAQNGYFVLAAGNNNLWEKLCQIIGKPELVQDVRFATNADRTKNVAELTVILENIFATNSVDYWVSTLEKADVPCSVVNGMDRIMQHPQVLARNMLVDVNDPEIGIIKVPGNPIKMTTIAEETSRPPAPKIGEHSEEILSKYLNYSVETLEELKEQGVI